MGEQKPQRWRPTSHQVDCLRRVRWSGEAWQREMQRPSMVDFLAKRGLLEVKVRLTSAGWEMLERSLAGLPAEAALAAKAGDEDYIAEDAGA